MENHDPNNITPQSSKNRKKLLIFGGIGLGILLIIAVILMVLLRNQESKEASPTTPSQNTKQSTTANFVPPTIAADSYASKEYSAKILIENAAMASKITVNLTTNPLLINDISFETIEGNGWIIELNSYDQSQGKATLVLTPASGAPTLLNNPIASFVFTSKAAVLSETAAITIAPESTITLQDDTILTLSGSPLQFIYPDVAPLVQ